MLALALCGHGQEVAGQSGAGAATAAAQKQEPPDRRALVEARRIRDPQQRVDALRRVVREFPKSDYAARANRLLLETLVREFPDRLEDIDAQADAVLKAGRKRPRLDRAYDLSDVGNTLGEGGVLLEKAEKLIRRALADFREGPYLAADRRFYAEQKLPVPSEEEMRVGYVRDRAGFTAQLGHVVLKRGRDAEAARLFEEAYRADSTVSPAARGLARLAARAGDDDKALEYYAHARLAGVLPEEDQKAFEALFRAGHGGALDGFEAWLDDAYRRRFPETFPVTRYAATAGRGDRAVLAELFTGAGCPPCAGADVAMDGIMERYGRRDVVALSYHLHIPRPDPMTNRATEERASFYGIASAPTLVVDGSPSTLGGGPRGLARGVYDGYTQIIDRRLEAAAEARLGLQASRDGARVHVTVSVDDVKEESLDVVVRVALVERLVRYGGENGIRFHPMVVRGLGGSEAQGFRLGAARTGRVEHTFDVNALSADLKGYLDDFRQHNERFGEFTFVAEPHEIDPTNLAVAAFVEDAAARRVLQAAFVDLAEGR
jgi:tetratricopeptide (TPR) repeat protein